MQELAAALFDQRPESLTVNAAVCSDFKTVHWKGGGRAGGIVEFMSEVRQAKLTLELAVMQSVAVSGLFNRHPESSESLPANPLAQKFKQEHHPDLGDVSQLPEVACVPLQVPTLVVFISGWPPALCAAAPVQPSAGAAALSLGHPARGVEQRRPQSAHVALQPWRLAPRRAPHPHIPLLVHAQYLLGIWGIVEADLLSVDVVGAE